MKKRKSSYVFSDIVSEKKLDTDTSPTLEDIKRYDQLGRDLQSKAIFSGFKLLKNWLLNLINN